LTLSSSSQPVKTGTLLTLSSASQPAKSGTILTLPSANKPYGGTIRTLPSKSQPTKAGTILTLSSGGKPAKAGSIFTLSTATKTCKPENRTSAPSSGIPSSDGTISGCFMDPALFPEFPKDDEIDLESIIFDPHYYYEKYSDVRQTIGYKPKELREHWNHTGIEEGRECSPALDLSFFITQMPKRLQTRQLNFRTAYKYFLSHIEDRIPSNKCYNPVLYVKRYPQLERYTAKQLMYHFISIGRFNKLNAACIE